MKTTPSISYSSKPRWRDVLHAYIEDNMTETILKATKIANKKYCYFEDKGVHKASKEFLVDEIMGKVNTLDDVICIDKSERTIHIMFENTLTSIINVLNRRKFSQHNLILKNIYKIQSSLLKDENSSKVGYISFIMVQKTSHKKKFKKRVFKYIKEIKTDIKDLEIFDFTRSFKYFTRDNQSCKKKFQGYYISVVLKIQLK